LSALKIQTASLGDEGLTIDSSIDGEALRPIDAKAFGLGQVHLNGVLSPLDGEFLFQGVLEADFTGSCDRCLEPVKVALELDVIWTFVQGSPDLDDDALDGIDADDSATYFDGHAIDLGSRAWEELVLAYPAKLICREGCKGLCTVCGQNLNEGPCACRTKNEDDDSAPTRKSLAGLGDLFPDLKPGAPED
jgi:uncharacterized metal-binding protein YceD (DUF177 family)